MSSNSNSSTIVFGCDYLNVILLLDFVSILLLMWPLAAAATAVAVIVIIYPSLSTRLIFVRLQFVIFYFFLPKVCVYECLAGCLLVRSFVRLRIVRLPVCPLVLLLYVFISLLFTIASQQFIIDFYFWCQFNNMKCFQTH